MCSYYGKQYGNSSKIFLKYQNIKNLKILNTELYYQSRYGINLSIHQQMNKEYVIHTHTHTHTHTQEYYSAMKSNKILPVCDKMNESRGNYVK